ncbi:hypothetical protein MGAD_00050 [Mycolicibacterium gadium]|uniref:Acyl-CoA dehydrogenase/oxidase C-terminal domain-containing protein n=1 Tax=Mycolicibacterium gadium TaxID=1794 RepID=A0A7I7WF68_MYCGU|nr:hypothetical protein MGAD_00050 [Mycolicibacterium gadium]
MTLLGFERGAQITTAAIDFGRDLDRLNDLARARGSHTDPHIRDGLAWCYSRVQIMRYQGYRGLTQLLAGQRPGRDAAISKVIWSEYFRRHTDGRRDPRRRDARPGRSGQWCGADSSRGGHTQLGGLLDGRTALRVPRPSTQAVLRSSAM